MNELAIKPPPNSKMNIPLTGDMANFMTKKGGGGLGFTIFLLQISTSH